MQTDTTSPGDMPPTPTTPLILIGGFLGAGKTTLLRALVPRLRANGVRPHVILNDYRNARIDAASLRLPSTDINPIAGTCICCGSQEELMSALLQAPLERRSVMLVEANGTADTTEIIEILTADRRAARYTRPVQVAVVDAQRWQERGPHNGLELTQVQTAGYLTLSRLETVDPPRRRAVLRSVGEVAARSRVVDPAGLTSAITALLQSADALPPRRFARSSEPEPQRPRGDRHRALHHFSSVEIPVPAPVEEDRLRRALVALPDEVLRVKGIVRLAGSGRTVYVERTDRRGSVELFPVPPDLEMESLLVLIGVGLCESEVSRVFSASGVPVRGDEAPAS